MGESLGRIARGSNFRGSKNAPKKIRGPKERISFRDLARFACGKKTDKFLAERTGKHPSTAKRWLSRKSRAPASAVYAVFADIFARLD